MIDRRSLRFRLTLLYTGAGFILLAALSFTVVVGVFVTITRPVARELAQTVQNVEDAASDANPAELQRILAREERNAFVVAIPISAMRQSPPQLPSGEISIGALFGIGPTFVSTRRAAFVVIPNHAMLDHIIRLFYIANGLTLAFALWLARFFARIGARATLKPLLTVTAELERFANGDFSPRPLQIANGTEFGALASAYNGAAYKVAEAFRERRRVEEHIRQFVADSGHELRTPLTVVAGYVDVLRRGGFDNVETRHDIFAALTIEVKRMRTLVERLMTLARLDRVLEAQPEVVDVGLIAGQAVNALAIVAHTPITLDAPDDLLVLGEPVDLYEVVANLLENALKYGGGTAIEVLVGTADTSIVVRVRDGGPGVPESERSRIFERFFRGADRAGVPGSGLGLAIAAKAAERLGGRVVLEDARAGSTTFALILPALDGLSPRARSATFHSA